jgi:hypothetical protein
MRLLDEGKRLRAEVAVLPRGRGRKYPHQLRHRILDWVGRALAKGLTETDCGDALGIPMHRFEMWRESDRARETAIVLAEAPTELVPVEVTGASEGGLVLVAPSGDRVEGLTVEQVIALLKALR